MEGDGIEVRARAKCTHSRNISVTTPPAGSSLSDVHAELLAVAELLEVLSVEVAVLVDLVLVAEDGVVVDLLVERHLGGVEQLLRVVDRHPGTQVVLGLEDGGGGRVGEGGRAERVDAHQPKQVGVGQVAAQPEVADGIERRDGLVVVADADVRSDRLDEPVLEAGSGGCGH